MFYNTYGHYELTCLACEYIGNNTAMQNLMCSGCFYRESDDYSTDSVYSELARPLSLFCAAALPLVQIHSMVTDH